MPLTPLTVADVPSLQRLVVMLRSAGGVVCPVIAGVIGGVIRRLEAEGEHLVVPVPDGELRISRPLSKAQEEKLRAAIAAVWASREGGTGVAG